MQILGPSQTTHAKSVADAITQATTRAVRPKANATNGTNGTSGANGSTGGSNSTTANTISSLTSQQTFLQLLIAQIQNQDPLNPTDSIQFVSQLVQYAELGQLTGINQGVQTLDGSTASSSNGSTNPTKGTSSS
jgi:flagellar basal-body rod modification protein FlgD